MSEQDYSFNEKSSDKIQRIAVIGLGNMGQRILRQLENEGYDATGISRTHNSLEDTSRADVAILAVKPQSFAEVATELRPHIKRQLVISIMAGTAIRTISSELETDCVVRTMPNLALTTGRSMTAYYGKNEDVHRALPIINLWGTSVRLEEESMFDAFTALAGSGPAYFFELTQILKEAAINYGFTDEQANVIAIATLKGAASVIGNDDSSAEWVTKVASKGGTTEAALRVFEERSLGSVVKAAVDAAAKRSKELRDKK